jgi:hypothetical protein
VRNHHCLRDWFCDLVFHLARDKPMKAIDIKTASDCIDYQAQVIKEQGEQISELYKQIGDLIKLIRRAQEDRQHEFDYAEKLLKERG